VMESAKLGKVRRVKDAAGRYIEFCKSTFPNTLDLRGLKIVLDCAHGATYHVAPPVFHELGAEIIVIGNQPDGININDGVGSTHPEALQKAVVAHQADLGIAFDGDGDRVMMVDKAGQLLDGDQLLYIIASARHEAGQLQGGVAGTLMTNLALEHKLQSKKIPFARAQVGDRYVLELLNQQQWQLGGENSGHILTLDKHSSGDGIIAALQVLQALLQSGKTLTDMLSELTLYPQVLINVKTSKKIDLNLHGDIQASVKAAEMELANSGRILLRASGTEPKIRVMVEGENQLQVQTLAERIAAVVTEATR
jgi:phosphoglucosamine mutase